MVEHKIQLVKLTRNINIKCKIKEDLKKATHKYWLLNSFTKLYLHRIPSAEVNVYSIRGGGRGGCLPSTTTEATSVYNVLFYYFVLLKLYLCKTDDKKGCCRNEMSQHLAGFLG